MAITYVTSIRLSEMLKLRAGVAAGGGVVVVDVRDDDRDGGHIPGSVHCPSTEFDRQLNALVQAHKDADSVVFHCMYSQQRGPKCARKFWDHLKSVESNPKCSVHILKEGFVGWVRRFYEDDGMIQDFRRNVWRTYVGDEDDDF